MNEIQLSRLDGVYVLASASGGVGRTSLAAALGHHMAGMGSDVLLVDLDPKGALSSLVGAPPEAAHPGVLQAFAHPDRAREWVRPTGYEGLSVLASDVLTPAHDAQLDAVLGDWRLLPRLLAPLRRDYHVVIVDVPAGTGRISRAAISAADRVMVPVTADPLGLRSLPRLLEAVRDAGAHGQVNLAGIVLNRVDPRAPFFSQTVEPLQRRFNPLMLETAIPADPWFVEAAARAMPVTALLPEAPASIAVGYLVDELLNRRR